MSKDQHRSVKGERRQKRNDKREGVCEEQQYDWRPQEKQPKPLGARTEAQGHYIIAIKSNKLTFGIGPAGTGKTYVCAALAAEALLEKQTDKIIITRPAIEAGESLGFLPGELDEKYEPYLQPFRDVFYERLGRSQAEYMMRHGRIEAAPLAYMRGRTFNDCWVILDEAQNTTPKQMLMFLTRIGANCKVIVNGDLNQADIAGENGLASAVARLKRVHDVSIIEFDRDDIVRSGLVRAILEAYDDLDK